MKFKPFIVTFIASLFFCVTPIANLFAESLTKDDVSVFQKELELSKEMQKLSTETENAPLVTANAQVLSVIAYTNTDFPQPWVDEKVIHIPEGWSYFSHGYHETTGLGNKKVYEPWVVRDPRNASRIIEVHLKVEAFARWFARSWVGAQLDVTIVPK